MLLLCLVARGPHHPVENLAKEINNYGFEISVA